MRLFMAHLLLPGFEIDGDDDADLCLGGTEILGNADLVGVADELVELVGGQVAAVVGAQVAETEAELEAAPGLAAEVEIPTAVNSRRPVLALIVDVGDVLEIVLGGHSVNADERADELVGSAALPAVEPETALDSDLEHLEAILVTGLPPGEHILDDDRETPADRNFDFGVKMVTA